MTTHPNKKFMKFIKKIQNLLFAEKSNKQQRGIFSRYNFYLYISQCANAISCGNSFNA